jgi:hypothetical protein
MFSTHGLNHIRLRWKGLPRTNTPAYLLIMVVKYFVKWDEEKVIEAGGEVEKMRPPAGNTI